MRKLRQHRVAIGIALFAILLAALMPAIAQWRAAMLQDPFAVYCTVEGTQAALGTKTTPRADAQRERAHDGHSGHDDAQAPPAPTQSTDLHSSHGSTDASLASADHWEKCGYCALWAHQPLVATDFHTPPARRAGRHRCRPPGIGVAVPARPLLRRLSARTTAPLRLIFRLPVVAQRRR